MAKTQTKLTAEEASERFATLSAAARALQEAIYEFHREYDCTTVGLVEWDESIDEILWEISADINATFEKE